MRLIRVAEVLHKCGFGRTTLWKMGGDDDFPTAVQLTGKAIAWREEEIDEWIANRVPVGAPSH